MYSAAKLEKDVLYYIAVNIYQIEGETSLRFPVSIVQHFCLSALYCVIQHMSDCDKTVVLIHTSQFMGKHSFTITQ